MGESFQDYSWIQDFEYGKSAPKSWISQFIQKTIDHLNLILFIFIGILQVLRFDFQKFRIFEILNFSLMHMQ